MKRINLMPSEAKRITPKKWLKAYLLKSRAMRLVTIVVVVFILINLWQATSLLRYKFALVQGKKNLDRLQEKSNQSQDIYAQLKGQKQAIEKEIRRIEDKFRVLQEARQEMFAWAGILAQLSKLVPEDLWINKIRLNKELITLSGTTFDNAVVSNFMARIDESDYFRETSFNYTQKSKLTDKSVINFEVTTHIDWERVVK